RSGPEGRPPELSRGLVTQAPAVRAPWRPVHADGARFGPRADRGLCRSPSRGHRRVAQLEERNDQRCIRRIVGIIDYALKHGRRGLPGGSSLAGLLAEPPPAYSRVLTLETVVAWGETHHAAHGRWPA